MASLRDILLFGVILFTAAIMFPLIFRFNAELRDNLAAQPILNASNASMGAINSITKVNASMDYMYFIIFLGLLLGIIFVAWLIGGHPIGMVIYSIIGIFSIILNIFFANAYEQISLTYFLPELSSFPLTNHIALNLPIYMIIAFILGFVIMFAKPAQVVESNDLFSI